MFAPAPVVLNEVPLISIETPSAHPAEGRRGGRLARVGVGGGERAEAVKACSPLAADRGEPVDTGAAAAAAASAAPKRA